jgi:hypothetical protein
MAAPHQPDRTPLERRTVTPDFRRESDLERAIANASARLRSRGVELSGDESSFQLARLLTAVEEFERAVERRGGDTFLNTRGSSQPENPDWVLPLRAADESVERYIRRLESAAERIEHGGE